MKTLIEKTQQLSSRCNALNFSLPVTHVYNPLDYAWAAHLKYLTHYLHNLPPSKRVLFMGINPGPWGMAQTGVPFGEVAQVRDWLGISSTITPPTNMHPKRPIDGFLCKKSEVSGKRLWQLFANRYGTANNFFYDAFVLNYCPLLFIDGRDNKAKNLTPDKLKQQETVDLYAYCDEYLKFIVAYCQPQWLVGIGNFAENKLQQCFANLSTVRIGKIIHPSPANPKSNKGFFDIANQQLDDMGL